MIEEKYYFKTEIAQGFGEAVASVREALSKEGFGVLTEVDVRATLKTKIGADFRPYVILGACNPPLAYKTLQAEKHIGLMLPCNVVVQEGEGGSTVVSAINPEAAMASVGNPELAPVAEEVTEKLRRVIASL